MSLKDLLVYLDGAERTEATMAAAAQLAQRHQARLSGLHVIGFLMPAQTGVGLGGSGNALAFDTSLMMIRDAALATACHAEAVFNAQRRAAGLAGDWHLAEGMVAYTAGLIARRFDMTIVGQVDPTHPPPGTRRLVPEALFLESGRPVLIIPCAGPVATLGRNVVVAWDGRREAVRAVNDALPLLKQAERVTVLAIQPEGGDADANACGIGPAAAVAHLAQHGVQATALARAPEGKTIAEALLAHATEAGADLLVMGGYGHSRLREAMVGGTTRAVLRRMTLPVLMSH